MAPLESIGMSDGRRVGDAPCCVAVAVAAEDVEEAEGKAEEAAGKAAGAATQREEQRAQQERASENKAASQTPSLSVVLACAALSVVVF